jgi:YggT family protein
MLTNLPCTLLSLYSFCLLGRIVLSYFPISPGSLVAQLFSFLYTITEPVLGPVRRVMPSLGGLDLSPLVIFFGIRILQSAICS